MRSTFARWVTLTASLLAFAAAAPLAQAAWPERPIRIIVPIAAGGSNDFAARLIAHEMTNRLGQSVIVENRPGASGMIGMQAAAQADADGYTLILTNSGALAITPALQNAGFDPLGDFVPVGMVMSLPIMLVVRKDLGVETTGELISLMRSKPHSVTFGSPGAGQTPHLATELLLRSINVDAVIATYRGAGPAATDLAGGVTQALFDTSATLKMVKSGSLKVLAVTGRQRSALMKDVPTLGEAGVANMEMSSWFALLAPAKTPPAIVERLNQVLNDTLRRPQSVEALQTINAEPRITTIEEARSEIAGEVRFWRENTQSQKAAKP